MSIMSYTDHILRSHWHANLQLIIVWFNPWKPGNSRTWFHINTNGLFVMLNLSFSLDTIMFYIQYNMLLAHYTCHDGKITEINCFSFFFKTDSVAVALMKLGIKHFLIQVRMSLFPLTLHSRIRRATASRILGLCGLFW